MSDFEDVKPYTQAELDQQAIWANEFDQWWENEGQYQRAGGGQYERSFAWWAWLNRQQKQKAIIDDLKTQLNNMEDCYIGVKKELEDQHKKVDEVLEYLDGESANRWDLWKEKADMLDQGASNAFEEAYWMVKKVLRGAND